jgi:DNA-binding response OmpR family regulator
VRLLVTDVVMPGMDGRALADALREAHPGIRVLFVSGYTQDRIAERGVLASGIEFLPKPFTAASLLSRVRAVLDA